MEAGVGIEPAYTALQAAVSDGVSIGYAIKPLDLPLCLAICGLVAPPRANPK